MLPSGAKHPSQAGSELGCHRIVVLSHIHIFNLCKISIFMFYRWVFIFLPHEYWDFPDLPIIASSPKSDHPDPGHEISVLIISNFQYEISWSCHDLYWLLNIFNNYKTRYEFVVLNKLSILTLIFRWRRREKYEEEPIHIWSVSSDLQNVILNFLFSSAWIFQTGKLTYCLSFFMKLPQGGKYFAFDDSLFVENKSG